MPKHYLNENLVDSSFGLFYKNREVILALNMGRIFYVNGTDGDDTTGARGRFDKPYKTIQAAINASSSTTGGDIIEVMSGTYNETVTGKVNLGVTLILRSATLNGNLSINVNTNTGKLFLLQGSVLNGNMTGTFGSLTISDGTGIVNGEIGSTGDNGGHVVKGLLKMTSTTQNGVAYNNCLYEDIGLITCSGDWNFRFQNNADGNTNQVNTIIRRIGTIRNTNANTTARVFQPNDNVTLDTLEDIALIECVNGVIYNDMFRNLLIYRCANVTFKSKLESFFAYALSGSFYDCKFVCSDDKVMRIYESSTTAFTSLKFYNCHFQAAASVASIIATHDAYAPKYVELIQCVYNKSTFWAGVQPTMLVSNFNSYVENFTIRLPKVL